ncbi:MAG TPA: CDP-diacylglycerol--glycerol-3-phosphate 3-phosphatidyltransferase [Streptosporangiaceae bacterium]|nr:CDP-diacylglycerol--glycerol-3-phosphate 3-phosphatidyltransferase [Streptosporangiaceae bacterium]
MADFGPGGPGNPGGLGGQNPSAVNVPNGLTLFRLALVPVFVLLLISGGTASRIAACVVFGVASVTDLLDGELARRHGLITDFGKIADPIADKALTGSALISLSALSELSWWVTVVIGVREIGVTALRFWVIRHGVIPASRGGKIKTVLQMVGIGLYILPVAIGPVRVGVMSAAVVVTLATGADYVARAIQLRRSVPAAVTGAGPGAAGGAGPERAGAGGAGAVGVTATGVGADAADGADEPAGGVGASSAGDPGAGP